MSGIYTGVQKRILAKQPKAMYIHCAAHNLNLVVIDAVCGVKQTSSFFSTLEELYIFFGHNIRGWNILSSITGESDVNLKTLNPSRWAGRLASEMGVKLRYTDVMKALSQFILLNANKDKREEAARLKKSLERYEFVLLVVIMSRVLSEINIASQYVERKDADLQKAVDHLSSASLNLSNYRSQFAEVKNEATNVWAKSGMFWKNLSRKESAKQKDILTNYLKTRYYLTQKIHSASTSLTSQLTQ